MIQLRQLRVLDFRDSLFDYPVILKIRKEELREYIMGKSIPIPGEWKWSVDHSLIFGGYFFDSDGNVLLPT